MELQLQTTTAKKLYPESPKWFQEVLVETFGEETFYSKNYDEIKTFADVCLECGTTEEEFKDKFSELDLDEDTINYEKLKLVVKAINKDWVPDWNDKRQYKWFPWFEVNSAGLVCVYSASSAASTSAYFGSRLCYESEAKCEYAAKQFIDIYNKFLL